RQEALKWRAPPLSAGDVHCVLIASELPSCCLLSLTRRYDAIMQPIWKGALSFGLVNIPVQRYSAIQAGERVSFRLLHRSDHSPIRYERVCQKDGKTVPWDDIVK